MKTRLHLGLVIMMVLAVCVNINHVYADTDPTLTLVRKIGRGDISERYITWSPDGRTLGVSSLAGLWLFSSDNFNGPSIFIEGQLWHFEFTTDSSAVVITYGDYAAVVDAHRGIRWLPFICQIAYRRRATSTIVRLP